VVEQIVTSRNSLPTEVTHSWEGGRAECYSEKLIVYRSEAEVDNEISRGNQGVTHFICSTTLSAMCYLYNGILLRHCTFQWHTNQAFQTNTHSPIIVIRRNAWSTEAKPRLTIKFPGVTICSTTLSVMCYLSYYTECSFLLVSSFYDFDALNFNCWCL
jgi:hypothetical protein